MFVTTTSGRTRRIKFGMSTVVLPLTGSLEQRRLWHRQLWEAGVLRRHRLVHVAVPEALVAQLAQEPHARTMGRGVEEERAFFEAALAAGLEAGRRARRGKEV